MRIELRPQPGKQEAFLKSAADVAFFGGGAGSGKSFGLLLEPLYDVANAGFRSVIFRRTVPMLRQPGGLVDTSASVFPLLGAKLNQSALEWTFPGGASVKFAGMELENDRFAWQGSQIALLCFDEVQEFEESQFWFLFSRNRSMSGVKCRIRATCNPVSDGWLRNRAASEQRSGTDPDATVGLLLGKTRQGLYVILDCVKLFATPHAVEKEMLRCAKQDGKETIIGYMQDPGSAGVNEAQATARALDGFNVRFAPATGDKETRCKPVSAQAEAGNVKIMRGLWNDSFLRVLENFPVGKHDDEVDALSGAHEQLREAHSGGSMACSIEIDRDYFLNRSFGHGGVLV